MATAATDSWKLESFLDSLIVELDRAQDTLAVKGVTRRLTYTVQDVALDLFVFPRFEDGKLRFNVARPGQEGASKISLSLGSITDRQIQESANRPPVEGDVGLEEVEDLDPEVKKTLQSVGIRSARDVERLSERQVDVGKLVANKTGGAAKFDYGQLAGLINRARRRQSAPRIKGLSVAPGEGAMALSVEGENLAIGGRSEGFPMALVNDRTVDVLEASADRLRLAVTPDCLSQGANIVRVALDPYAVVSFELGWPGSDA